MDDHAYEALAAYSTAIHGQRHVIPIAAWIRESGQKVFSTPEVVRALGGRLQSGEVLVAMSRLVRFQALQELPHPGAPRPRIFEIEGSHPYWAFLDDLVARVDA
jgi:hypothetical protein